MPINTPILLTWLRIVAIPIFVAVYYLPDTWLSPVAKNWTAMGIFSAAAITDWLDGYLARKWGETSAFGAFLDPVADKLMVAAALILLVQLGRAEAYLAIIIIGREIAISALREWMAQIGKTRNVAVAFIGKVKTARADDGDHRAAVVGAADSRHPDADPGHRRAVGRGDPDAMVDVPLPAAGRAASARRRDHGTADHDRRRNTPSGTPDPATSSTDVTCAGPSARTLRRAARFP